MNFSGSFGMVARKVLSYNAFNFYLLVETSQHASHVRSNFFVEIDSIFFLAHKIYSNTFFVFLSVVVVTCSILQ